MNLASTRRAPGTLAQHGLRAIFLLCISLASVISSWSAAAAPASRSIVPRAIRADPHREVVSGERPPGTLPWAAPLSRAELWFYFEERDRGAAKELLSIAAEARAEIAEDLGRDPGGRFDLYLCHDQPSFSRLLGGAPDWMSGVAYSRAGWAAIRLDPRGQDPWGEVEETFRHELSHLMLRRAVGPKVFVPRWFNEGFAIFQSREWSLGRASTLTRGLLRGRLLPLSALSRGFPARRDLVELAYAQSVAFTGYLIRRDSAAFSELTLDLAAEIPFEAALARSYGQPLSELEAAWLNQLERNYAWIPTLFGGGTLWILVTALFLLAYLSKRHRQRATLRSWEEEEALIFAQPE